MRSYITWIFVVHSLSVRLQCTGVPCLALSPWVCSNSCQLSLWCHPIILSSVVPCSCLQFFPALGSFPMSWFFTLDDQSIGASTSASILPMNIQNWFPLGLTGLIFLRSSSVQFSSVAQSCPTLCDPMNRSMPGLPVHHQLLEFKGLSRVFSNTTVQKHQFFSAQPSLWSNSHIHTWLLEKPWLWLYGASLEKWCLCFLIVCLGLS